MPATKTNVAIFDGTQNFQGTDASGGPITKSGVVDLRTRYGGIWQIIVTNGANRQSKGVEIQAEVGPDQVDANFVPFDCRRVAIQDANGKTPFAIRIPHEPQFSRIVVKHGNEDATIVANFTRVDQV